MKTRYKHIHFTEEPTMNVEARPMWFCRNNRTGGILGSVTFYDDWNRWVFEGEPHGVFDSGCLRDIAAFLDDIKKG